MSRTASRIIGIVAIVLSAGSAGLAVKYWFIDNPPRTKHGLLFAAVFLILFLFGLISLRARGRAGEQGGSP
jgi:hypothetical protein